MSDSRREVIARRNRSAEIMNIVVAVITVAALAYLIYLACTAEDTGMIAMGVLLAVLAAAIAAYNLVQVILAVRQPEELIVQCGADLIIKGKKYIIADISMATIKLHRKNGGEFSTGDITISLKKGGKVVCRGVADAQNSYKKFCALISGGVKTKKG